MIRIIAGVYGYRENGIITPKDKDSRPFSLNPEREAELVRLGIAEYIDAVMMGDKKEITQPDEEHGQGNEADHDCYYESVEYNSEMKLAQLKKMANEHGINTNKMKSKAEVINALDQYFAEVDNQDTEDDKPNEDLPTFGAIDPV